jgi:hypothetical protein
VPRFCIRSYSACGKAMAWWGRSVCNAPCRNRCARAPAVVVKLELVRALKLVCL